MSNRQAPSNQHAPNQQIRLVSVSAPVQGAFYPQPVILQPGAQYYPGQVIQAPYQFVQVNILQK